MLAGTTPALPHDRRRSGEPLFAMPHVAPSALPSRGSRMRVGNPRGVGIALTPLENQGAVKVVVLLDVIRLGLVGLITDACGPPS